MAEHIPKVRLHVLKEQPDPTVDLGIVIASLPRVALGVDADNIPFGKVVAGKLNDMTLLGYKPADDMEPARQAFGAETLPRLEAEAYRKLGWLARNGQLPLTFPQDVVAVLFSEDPVLLEAMRDSGFDRILFEGRPIGNRWRLRDPNAPKPKKRSKKK